MAGWVFRYFAADGRELTAVRGVRNDQFEEMGGVRSKHNAYDSYQRLAGKDESGALVPVARRAEFKGRGAKLHKCDGRCRSAKGFQCECECRGQYHGVGR